MFDLDADLLPQVQKPSRYIGGEWNEIVKEPGSTDLTFALAFPDVYEIGMSHLGFRILYSLLNSREDTAAERVFCPWPDMADLLQGAPATRWPLWRQGRRWAISTWSASRCSTR